MKESTARVVFDAPRDEDLLLDEAHPSRSRLVRWALLTAGTLAVILGAIGAVLPILPTTPFLLLATTCYAHSSQRFYDWMIDNRYFGRYIRDWRENRGITLATKIWALTVIAVTFSTSIFLFVPLVPVKGGMALVGLCVSGYIWRLPTKQILRVES